MKCVCVCVCKRPSQKLAKRITLVSFSTPSLPPQTNRNRKTGFNVPLRKGSADFHFQTLAIKKCALKSCYETADCRKMENHKLRRKRTEESGRRHNNGQSQNSGDPNMFEKNFSIKVAARSSCNRFAAGHGGAQHTLSTCSSFFFLKFALRRRSRPPPPQTNALHFASFCELLRRPLNDEL